MADGSDQNRQETSPAEGLAMFFTEEILKNFTMEGSDGRVVRANRQILSSRSTVFQAMLLGDFEEGSTSPVRIAQFKGAILEAIYEYVCTATTRALQFAKISGSVVTEDDIVQVNTLVSLAGAADFFDLPCLGGRACSCINKSLNACPSLSFTVFEAYKHQDPRAPAELEEIALETIRSNATALDTTALAHLSNGCLEEILQDDAIALDEYDVFRIVQLWAEAGGTQNRISSARNLAHYIHLENISSFLLDTVVANSCLVTTEELLTAHRSKALEAEENHGLMMPCHRRLPVWQNSSTSLASAEYNNKEEVDCLQHNPIIAGKHRWKVVVEEIFNPTWLGVALTGKDLDREVSLGKQDCGWAFSSQGGVRHGERNEQGVRPSFARGSKVTFTLNLCPEDNASGTLSASVDGCPDFVLFSNLQAELEGHDGGFVPAVSLRSPASIRLEGIQRLK